MTKLPDAIGPWEHSAQQSEPFVPEGCISVSAAFNLLGHGLHGDMWPERETFLSTLPSPTARRRQIEAMAAVASEDQATVVQLDETNENRADDGEHWFFGERAQAWEDLDPDGAEYCMLYEQDQAVRALLQQALFDEMPCFMIDERTGRREPVPPGHWIRPGALVPCDAITLDLAGQRFEGHAWVRRRDVESLVARLRGDPAPRTARATGEKAPLEGISPAGSQSPENAARQPPGLRQASVSEIHEAILAEYDEADRSETKPPNLRQIGKAVQARLSKGGFKASDSRIQKLAEDPTYDGRRWQPGKRSRA